MPEYTKNFAQILRDVLNDGTPPRLSTSFCTGRKGALTATLIRFKRNIFPRAGKAKLRPFQRACVMHSSTFTQGKSCLSINPKEEIQRDRVLFRVVFIDAIRLWIHRLTFFLRAYWKIRKSKMKVGFDPSG